MKKSKITLNTIVFIITYFLIIATAIIYKQPFYRLLPLLVSGIVMTLQASANRYGYLLGGLNCILYTIVYIHIKTYMSAVSTIFTSMPIQLFTFFYWQKHAYEKSVVFKKMSAKSRIIAIALFLMASVICISYLKQINSGYAILDSLTSLLSIFVSFFTLFAYVEYTYIWPVSAFLNVLLCYKVFLNEPSQITYLISAIYSLYCVIGALINVSKIHNIQKEEILNENQRIG